MSRSKQVSTQWGRHGSKDTQDCDFIKKDIAKRGHEAVQQKPDVATFLYIKKNARFSGTCPQRISHPLLDHTHVQTKDGEKKKQRHSTTVELCGHSTRPKLRNARDRGRQQHLSIWLAACRNHDVSLQKKTLSLLDVTHKRPC